MKEGLKDRKYDIYIILSLLAVIIIVLGLALMKQEPPDSNGTAHPLIEEMRIGGDGAVRIEGFEATTFLLFTCTILIFIALMVFGVSRRNRTRNFWLWTGIGTLFLLGVCYKCFDSYFDYLSGGNLRFFLGFPEPTAWMIYGIWGGGTIFVLIYVIGFKKFIYTKEDEALLQEIAEEYAKEREDK